MAKLEIMSEYPLTDDTVIKLCEAYYQLNKEQQRDFMLCTSIKENNERIRMMNRRSVILKIITAVFATLTTLATCIITLLTILSK